MKNYAEMSDFEINVEVAKASGLDVQYQSMRNDGRVLVVVKIDCGVERYYRVPDYCNNWSDAGPVIVDNRISLNMEEMEEIAYHGVYYDEISGSVDRYEFSANAGVNPLRAAMIVFLMMKDA